LTFPPENGKQGYIFLLGIRASNLNLLQVSVRDYVVYRRPGTDGRTDI